MSYVKDIKFSDSPQLDGFNKLKVRTPYALFDNMGEYGNNTFLWETQLTNGTVSHVTNNCALRLSTGGTTSGNKAIRQTKQYMRYQPGRSLNIETTFVMSTAVTNSSARIGYFDANNGIFLERTTDATTTTSYIVRRTKVTGTAVDNQVAQSSWNVDKMDGTGPSGKTLDLTKAQILFIQLQYLGVGRVQVGFVIDGLAYIAHEFLNANNLSTVYMSSGCLPVRGEVINNGTSSGTLTMDMFCTSVSSGGQGAEKLRYARSNGITTITTSTTLVPLISLRAGTTAGGSGGTIRNTGIIRFEDFSVSVGSATHEIQVLLNPTLTGASFTANGPLSIAEYDVSATQVSGGTLLDSSYISSSGAARSSILKEMGSALPIVCSGLNGTNDTLVIAARTIAGAGTAQAAITWNEEF